jgi:hypothetical protein
MPETANDRRSGRFPRGFLGMLALVLLVERFVARNPIDLARPEQHEWAMASRAASSDATGAEVLCLGSSMSSFGLMPAVLTEVTGKPSYNLSLCCGPAPALYFLLRRALEAGAKPSALLIEIHPAVLAEPVRFAAKYWPQMLSMREGLELCRAGSDPSLFASITVACWLPSARNRDQIRTLTARTLRGELNDARIANLMILRNKTRNRGGMLQPNKDDAGASDAKYRAELAPDAWAPDPANDMFVHRLLDLAEARGIPVFWQIPPLRPPLAEARRRKGLDRSYAGYVQRLQARYSNVTVIDGLDAGYRSGLFCDSVHLNRDGAIAYSHAVAEIVAERLSGSPRIGRWVDLPGYQPWADDALEDLRQTEAVVLAAPGTIRR